MILLNKVPVEFKSFPNGETKLIHESMGNSVNLHGENTLFFKYQKDGDLIRLMIVKDFLDYCELPTSLTIAYMPYSRMDRSEDSSPFTLKYIAKFINQMNFLRVIVIEPHSDVTPALLDRCFPYYINFDLLPIVQEEIGFDKEDDILFFPDAGAQKRYHNLKGYKQLVGYKDRDFETGEIKDLKIVGLYDDPQRYKRKVIIVDDLSSYGGTFLKSASKLQKIGFRDIYLLVAHAENSIFYGGVFTSGLIKKVFTTNSILNEYDHIETLGGEPFDSKIKIYKLEELL